MNSFSGDIIVIVDDTDDEWCLGKFNGKSGYFPKSYVEIVPFTPQSPKKNSNTKIARVKFDYLSR